MQCSNITSQSTYLSTNPILFIPSSNALLFQTDPTLRKSPMITALPPRLLSPASSFPSTYLRNTPPLCSHHHRRSWRGEFRWKGDVEGEGEEERKGGEGCLIELGKRRETER